MSGCYSFVPEAELAAIKTWWEEQHAASLAAPPPDTAPPPPAAFDETVASGESIQAAVGRCPDGGSILLLPGRHVGPLLLDKGVHVHGRGAALLTSPADVVVCTAAGASLDGVVIRKDAHLLGDGHFGVLVSAGALTLRHCDIASASRSCIALKVGDRVTDWRLMTD